MTEAMKTMDSGMSAAEMELRAVSKALPAAVPSVPVFELQPPNSPGTDSGTAAKPAQTVQASIAVGQEHNPAVQLQQSDPLQKDMQQQKPNLGAGQRSDQPLPALGELAEATSQKGEHVGGNTSVVASADIVEAASKAGSAGIALPAAGTQPQSKENSEALKSEASTSGNSQQSAQARSAMGMSKQPDASRVNKQTGLQMQIHADCSADSKAGPQPAGFSLESTAAQRAAEDSNALVVSETSTAHDSTVQTVTCSPVAETTPMHGSMTHPAVEHLPKASKASDADKASSGMLSSAEVVRVNGGSTAVTETRQADCAASAAASNHVQCDASGIYASSCQQGTVGDPWAADEGDFAVMLKDFLVWLLLKHSC